MTADPAARPGAEGDGTGAERPVRAGDGTGAERPARAGDATGADRPVRAGDATDRERPARRTAGAAATDGPLIEDLVVVTGMSGAGKSTVMQVFEDAGYFCVDNLPPDMLEPLAQLFAHDGSKVDRACVVSDTRGGEYFERLAGVIDAMAGSARVLFLTADDQTLLNRYKETRRRHPLAPSGSVADGVVRERRRLEPLRERADELIDTTGLSANALRAKVARELLPRGEQGRLAVTFTSFGHKHGTARDADLAFDVRFLPNPHYDAKLRPLTGFDQRVVDYIAQDGRLDELYGRLTPLLDWLLAQYVAEGKAHLVVAIGCTGGRHRSVAIAEHLAAHYRGQDRYFVEVQHRDVDRTRVT